MRAEIADWIIFAGRLLLAALFGAGCIQKIVDPQAAQSLLQDHGLPVILVWPAMVFNGAAALCLTFGVWLTPVSLALAVYCMITSVFHFIPDDPWQMSIFVKNWAIAGGFLVMFGTRLRETSV